MITINLRGVTIATVWKEVCDFLKKRWFVNFLETLPLESALYYLKNWVVIPVALRIITCRKYIGNRDFSSLLQGDDEQLLMKTDNSKKADDVYRSLW